MEMWFLLFQSFQVDGEPWYIVSERVSSLVLEEGRCNKSFSLFLARTVASWKQDRVSSEQFFCCWWAPKLVLRGCNMRVPFFSTWLPSRGGHWISGGRILLLCKEKAEVIHSVLQREERWKDQEGGAWLPNQGGHWELLWKSVCSFENLPMELRSLAWVSTFIKWS